MTEEWNKDSEPVTDATLTKVPKEPKDEKLIIPVEEYTKVLTDAQRAAIREHRISRYPNLFDVRGFKEDIISTHPLVEMSNETRLYTSLFEESFKRKLRKAKKKKEKN